MSSLRIITNGRIIDPKNDRDEVADLYIKDGKIAESLSDEEIQKFVRDLNELYSENVVILNSVNQGCQ